MDFVDFISESKTLKTRTHPERNPRKFAPVFFPVTHYLREFGINYTFLTYARHSLLFFVRHHRADYLCIILITDAEGVFA